MKPSHVLSAIVYIIQKLVISAQNESGNSPLAPETDEAPQEPIPLRNFRNFASYLKSFWLIFVIGAMCCQSLRSAHFLLSLSMLVMFVSIVPVPKQVVELPAFASSQLDIIQVLWAAVAFLLAAFVTAFDLAVVHWAPYWFQVCFWIPFKLMSFWTHGRQAAASR